MAAIAPLLAGIVFLGVYPRPFLDRVTPSVSYLLAHVEHTAPNADVPQTQTAVKFTIPAEQNVDVSPSLTAAEKGGGQ
jgi:hypothetical protein